MRKGVGFHKRPVASEVSDRMRFDGSVVALVNAVNLSGPDWLVKLDFLTGWPLGIFLFFLITLNSGRKVWCTRLKKMVHALKTVDNFAGECKILHALTPACTHLNLDAVHLHV